MMMPERLSTNADSSVDDGWSTADVSDHDCERCSPSTYPIRDSFTGGCVGRTSTKCLHAVIRLKNVICGMFFSFLV